ncbi:MAG: LysR family transcriptional regulator [Lentisphaeria bacterium]|nr:LysR family transcriptional regulator [Lentisphaeria bacterium]
MIEQKLRIFRTAAITGNFTEAAALLGMTQPNVTQQIAKLEKELKVLLFSRNGRTLSLTPAGETLLEECERLFSLESEVLRKVRCAEEKKHFFTLGGTLIAGSFLLIGMTTLFERSFPNYVMGLKIARLDTLLPRLASGELALAVTEEPCEKENFLSEPYCKDLLLPVFAPGVVKNTRFSLGDYIRKGGKVLISEFGDSTHLAFRSFLREKGLPEPEPDRITEAGSLEALKQLLQAGAGIAVLSSLAVESEARSGVLRSGVFTEGTFSREIRFVYHPAGDQKFIRKFISFCVKHRGVSLK